MKIPINKTPVKGLIRGLSVNRISSTACLLLLTMLVGCFVFCDCASSGDYPLRPAPVGSVKVDGGFWGPRVTTNATVTVPHNFEFLETTPRLANFDRAAGIDAKSARRLLRRRLGRLQDHRGRGLFAATAARRGRRGNLARQVGRVIAAQQEDGFLCPRVTLKNPESRWDELRKSHVLYSAGHLFEAGVA